MMSIPGTDQSVTPGAQLSAARVAAGLSVADVAAQMRISARQVEALEADRYAELPGTVFVRGFIRNYARVLRLDAVPLLHSLEPVLGEEAPLKAHATAGKLPVSARRDHSKLLLVAFAVLFVLVVAAGAYELWSRQQAPSVPLGAAASGEELSPAQPQKQTASSMEMPLSAQSVPTVPQQEPSSVPTPNAEVAAHALPADPAPPIPVAVGGGEGRSARIVVQFTRDTWVEIRDREGKVLTSGTGRASSERQLEGQAPFAVVIGNVSGVRMTYNEKPLDLASYAAHNIARFTLE